MKKFSLHTVDKLRNLFFTYGIKSVTMDDISRELGISKKTLYEYVSNKQSLIKKIVKSYLENNITSINEICQTSENAIQEFLDINRFIGNSIKTVNPAIIYQMKKYYPESWALFDEYNSNFIYKVVKQNIIKGKSQRIYRDDINESLTSKFYISNIMIATDQKYFPASDFSILDIHNERVMYHLNGLCNSEGITLLENLKYSKNEI